jgi:hypothetical protein
MLTGEAEITSKGFLEMGSGLYTTIGRNIRMSFKGNCYGGVINIVLASSP